MEQPNGRRGTTKDTKVAKMDEGKKVAWPRVTLSGAGWGRFEAKRVAGVELAWRRRRRIWTERNHERHENGRRRKKDSKPRMDARPYAGWAVVLLELRRDLQVR